MNEPFKLSVGSAAEYERLIAEVHFPGKCGFILSQEGPNAELEISLHSFISTQQDDFDFERNVVGAKISLADFREALDQAVMRLQGAK